MTQPPLSRQIQLLEHHVGTQLFARSSRNVRLTPAGRGFLPEAREILRLAESASLAARRVSRGEAGIVTIGFTASSAPEASRVLRSLGIKGFVTGNVSCEGAVIAQAPAVVTVSFI